VFHRNIEYPLAEALPSWMLATTIGLPSADCDQERVCFRNCGLMQQDNAPTYSPSKAILGEAFCDFSHGQ
jgi:hypothetical protein